MVSHLCDRLAKSDDGQPRIFRDSAVLNLDEFFERFKSLNVSSNAQLDALVEQAHARRSKGRPQPSAEQHRPSRDSRPETGDVERRLPP